MIKTIIDTNKFKSSLGEVALTSSHIERVENDSSDWKRIRENFSEEKLVDYARYDDIQEMELERGSIFPNIRLKIDDDWKRMFFHVGDEVEECFKRLKYRWHSYQQNN